MRQEDARLRHLEDLYQVPAYTDIHYEAWSSKRLDRLMIDYMLRQGYVSSAKELSDKQDLADLVDVETLTVMNRIRTSLQNRSVLEAIAWCAQNKKELRKLDVCPLTGAQPSARLT
jgi:macrophage erythroblast attacher